MTTTQERVVIVDYLRGIAALMVVWYHVTDSHLDNWVGQSGSFGWLGVEIFFVISGFAITYALQRSAREPGVRRYLEFMIRRLIRLEPPYILSVILTVAAVYVSARLPGFRGTPVHYSVPGLLFHLAYLIPFTRYEWIQPVYWTLTYEFFFYLIGGMVIPLLAYRWGTLIFCATAVVAAALVLAGIAPPLILLFLVGIAACRLRTGREHWSVAIPLAVGCAIVMAVVGKGLEGLVGLLTAALIVAPLPVASLPRPIAALLGGLGAISYSLYLVHVPVGGRVVNLGARFAILPPAQFAASALALIVSCVAAGLFWWAVERPAMRAAHRFRLRRRTSPAPAD